MTSTSTLVGEDSPVVRTRGILPIDLVLGAMGESGDCPGGGGGGGVIMRLCLLSWGSTASIILNLCEWENNMCFVGF